MSQHVIFKTLESGIYLYNVHYEYCQVGWQYPREKHGLFELLYIKDGHQRTVFDDGKDVVCGPGDAVLISPGTSHVNSNDSQHAGMEYFCLHFNVENLRVKSIIIKYLSNIRLAQGTELADASQDFFEKVLVIQHNKQLGSEERKIKYEITFLEFLQVLVSDRVVDGEHEHADYSEREAELAQRIALTLKGRLDDKERINITEIYQRHNISSAYGHRVFKKVYGLSPNQYVTERRYNKAKMLLRVPEYTLEDISEIMNFSGASSFSKQFKRWSGMTPGEFQKNQVADREDANYLRPGQMTK